MSLAETEAAITAELDKLGVKPDRRSITADKSVLLQFLTGRDACVDIFPDGDIIVIIRDGGQSCMHECTDKDARYIAEIVRECRLVTVNSRLTHRQLMYDDGYALDYYRQQYRTCEHALCVDYKKTLEIRALWRKLNAAKERIAELECLLKPTAIITP